MPDGWKDQFLSELCERITDGSHFSPPSLDEGIPIATVANMGSRSFELNRCALISEKDFALLERNGCRPRAGDVLFSKDGSVGKVLVMQDSPRLVLLSSIAILTPRCKELESSFLGQCLKWPRVLRRLHGMRTGTAIKRVVLRDLRKLPLSVPPVSEQRRIAAILSSVDDAIEKTQAVIDQVQVVKRGLMQELLTRGLPGRHTRFKQTQIGEIPEEWEVVELASVATVERGKFAHRPRNEPRFYGGKYPFIQTGDVAACDGLIATYSQTLNEEGLAISKLFPSGTIAITIAANIGSTGIATLDVAFPDSLVGIQAGPRIDTRFLELALRTRKGDLEKYAPESAQKNINLNTLKPLRVPLPGMTEQRQIAESVWSIIKREKNTRQQCDGLKQLKSALMSALLTGEIRVTPDSATACLQGNRLGKKLPDEDTCHVPC